MKRAGVEADPARGWPTWMRHLPCGGATAYAEFPDNFMLRLEAIRLDELRLAALEKRGGLLLEIGRAADAVADMEQFVRRIRIESWPGRR